MTDLSSSAVFTPVKQTKKGSNMNTPLPSKGWYPNVESGSKQSTTISYYKKSVSMKATAPAFVTPMKMPMPNSRDIAILHESRIFKSLLEKAAKKREQQHQSPKRDPILQEGDDYVQEFRPCCKRLPASSEKYSECIDENFRRTKKVGDFNYIYNPPQEPKPQGIKSFIVFPSPCLDEIYRRISKPGRHQSQAPRNPLTEGDEQSAIFRRSKRPGVACDHQERLNNRKHVLPADRGRSCRGRVFRDMTFTLGENDFMTGSFTDRSHTQQRPLTAQEKRMRGVIKGILEYEDGPNYRPEVVTDKCNKMKFSDIVNTTQESVNERIFGRKRTLEY